MNDKLLVFNVVLSLCNTKLITQQQCRIKMCHKRCVLFQIMWGCNTVAIVMFGIQIHELTLSQFHRSSEIPRVLLHHIHIHTRLSTFFLVCIRTAPTESSLNPITQINRFKVLYMQDPNDVVTSQTVSHLMQPGPYLEK